MAHLFRFWLIFFDGFNITIFVNKDTGSVISKGWENALTRIRSLGTKKKPDNFINENGDIEAIKKDEPKPE
jgi:hypothetical protein